MVSYIARLATLAVFSGLSVNLVLQLGLGLKKINLTGAFVSGDISIPGQSNSKKRIFTELGMLFTAVFLLWLVFSFFRSVLFLGLLEYVLVFPVSLAVFYLLDYAACRYIFRKKFDEEEPVLFGGALSGAALFITLNTAGNILDAAVLSAGFTAGIALAIIITGEILRRSVMEKVPAFLRGGPLVLIAMGLLSLVFLSAALMLYQVLGAR